MNNGMTNSTSNSNYYCNRIFIFQGLLPINSSIWAMMSSFHNVTFAVLMMNKKITAFWYVIMCSVKIVANVLKEPEIFRVDDYP
jgi:hypothetical protein